MHWETKKFMWLTLLPYLLYCSVLEPNLQLTPRYACTWNLQHVALCVCFLPHSIMHLRTIHVVMLINQFIPFYCWVVFHCVDIPACLSTYQQRDIGLFTCGDSLAPRKYPVSHHINLSPNGFIITGDPCLNQVFNWELQNGDFLILSFLLH